jgi:hypothetical protein
MDRAAAATRADRTADREQPQVLDELQVRQSLQLLRRSLHWFLLVLASYLLIHLLLGYFPYPGQQRLVRCRGTGRLQIPALRHRTMSEADLSWSGSLAAAPPRRIRCRRSTGSAPRAWH